MLEGGCGAARTGSVADGQVQEEDGISARSDGGEDTRKYEPGCMDRRPEGGVSPGELGYKELIRRYITWLEGMLNVPY